MTKTKTTGGKSATAKGDRPENRRHQGLDEVETRREGQRPTRPQGVEAVRDRRVGDRTARDRDDAAPDDDADLPAFVTEDAAA